MRIESKQVLGLDSINARNGSKAEEPDHLPPEKPSIPRREPNSPSTPQPSREPRPFEIVPGYDSLPQVSPVGADARGSRRQERTGGSDLSFMIRPTADVLQPRIESAGATVPQSGDLAPNKPLLLRPAHISRPRPIAASRRG